MADRIANCAIFEVQAIPEEPRMVTLQKATSLDTIYTTLAPGPLMIDA